MRRIVLAAIACWSSIGVCDTATRPPAVGDQAPDFTTKELLTGQVVRLSEQRGKLVFVTFWASWCAPCRQELPILNNVQKKLGPAGGVVYAVSFHERDSLHELSQMARSGDWKLTLLGDTNSQIADLYGVRGIPHLLIIGRDGRILAVHTGYGNGAIDELVVEINAALKAPARAQ